MEEEKKNQSDVKYDLINYHKKLQLAQYIDLKCFKSDPPIIIAGTIKC